MRISIHVFDWQDRHHLYVEQVADAPDRKVARRKRLYTLSVSGRQQMTIRDALALIQQALDDAGEPPQPPGR